MFTRSKQLRDYAMEYYSDAQGRISCSCCTFNFADFYGSAIGNEFIEIHHVKPIFKYEGGELIKTIKEAVKNVTPVCSNCHRMIHRNWSKPLEILQLTTSVNANGVFSRFSGKVTSV